jgi:hypothetical protein
MSVEAMSWVFKHSPYTLGSRLVHLALADVANDGHDNRVWMAQKTIADKAGLSTRQVARILQTMVDDGALVLVSQGVGRGNASEYRLVMETGQSVTVSEPESLTDPAENPTTATENPTNSVPSKPGTQEELKEPNPSRRKQQTPIGDDFSVTDEMRQWARDSGLEVDLVYETAQFRDHAIAHDRRARNWEAAWRTWIRKAEEIRLARQPSMSPLTPPRQEWEP